MDSAQLPKYPFMFSIAIEFPRVKGSLIGLILRFPLEPE